jgi:hypothetical protein
MAKQKQQFLGVYENMDFPPYKYVEYPKVVGYRDSKKLDPIIVGDAREEVDFITTGSPGAHISREDELQAELDRKAVELEAAKKMLADLKASQEKAKASVLPLPAGKKEV